MKVRAKVKCFVGHAVREAGEVFDYDGPNNGCLEEIKAAAAPPPSSKKAPPGKGDADFD